MQKIPHWEKKNWFLKKKQNCRAIYILYIFPLGFIFIKVCCCFVFKLQKWHLKTTFSRAAIFMVMWPGTYVCGTYGTYKTFWRLGEFMIGNMPKPEWEEVSFHRYKAHVKNVSDEEPVYGCGQLSQWPETLALAPHSGGQLCCFWAKSLMFAYLETRYPLGIINLFLSFSVSPL